MKHVLQPKGSDICTQCSVAMITGAPLEEIFQAFGHAHSSNLNQAYSVLKRYGFKEKVWLTKIDNRFTLDLSGHGLLRAYPKGLRNKHGHMMAFKDGMIYDPEGKIYNGAKEFRQDYASTGSRKWFVDYVLYLEEGGEQS